MASHYTKLGDALLKNHRFCVAPMMDWTDRHARYLYRLMTKRTLLYTEMVTTGAILHGDRHMHLRFDPLEQPIALQLGGSSAADLATCARIGEDWGYSEINLNCGCPSDRVQEGAFGACLMKQPELMADLVAAMEAAVAIPVTVKTRIGVDDIDSYDALAALTEKLQLAGVDGLILHARKAWLTGLSPAENRTVPPLDYPAVYRIKSDFPELPVIINGGIDTLDQAKKHLDKVDGVMMGRAAYKNPWQLSEVDHQLFGDNPSPLDRRQLLESFYPYMETELSAGTRLSAMSRHLLGLYQGVPGGRRFRRIISEGAHVPGAGIEVLEAATAHLHRVAEAAEPKINLTLEEQQA
jgi:tRNA-dihydrouridine synthase A